MAKKGILSALAFFILLDGCAAESPVVRPFAVPVLSSSADPSSSQAASSLPPRLIRHVLIGYGKSIYEFQNAVLDVLFEEGTVDGFLVEENYAHCAVYRFSIYDFEPKDGMANQLYINGNLFQRFGKNIHAPLAGELFGPPGYTREDIAEIFRAADEVIAAYNALLTERTDKVIDYTDPHGPYDRFYRKSIALAPSCQQSEDKLTPDIFKRFMP